MPLSRTQSVCSSLLIFGDPEPLTLHRVATFIAIMDDADRCHQELLVKLDELVLLLRTHAEQRWADRLDHDRRALVQYDANALDPLLGAYGGMGSFVDLIIHPMNGHSVTMDMTGEVNERLSKLRSVASRGEGHRSRGSEGKGHFFPGSGLLILSRSMHGRRTR